jgi:hypothetical protein
MDWHLLSAHASIFGYNATQKTDLAGVEGLLT